MDLLKSVNMNGKHFNEHYVELGAAVTILLKPMLTVYMYCECEDRWHKLGLRVS